MLKNEDIDVVNICTPSGLHCEHVLAAARAGKHVLCEKPLDVTREKLDLMVQGCKDAGVKLGGIFQRRTNAAAIQTRNAVREGKLGNIVLASAYLKYYRDQEYYDSAEWRGTWELDGGGALANQGIHGIDLLQWMAGDVESVYARCATLARKIDVEDTAVVSIKFKNGALGIIEGATSVYPGQDTVFSVHGANGSVTIGDKGFYEWKFLDSEETAPEAGDGFGGPNCGWNSTNTGHTKQIQDMAEAVLYDRQPMVPGEEARKAVDLLLAIYESSRKGIEIKL
jgi:predicted dehydrogenase